MSEQRPLLEVEGLRVEFKTRNGIARVIDDLHLSVMPGETLGVVGESGCGKSMTALSIMGLVPIPPGRIAAGKIMLDGDMDAGAWSCGMVAGLIDDIPTCRELIDRIMADAESLIRQRLEGFVAA